MRLQRKYWSIRRKLLKLLVPEFIWPKETIVDGVPFKVRNTPYSYGTKKGLQNGDYEVNERQLLRGQIRKGDVIIEMGGSIGVLTALLAHEAGSNGFVVSVEASKNITSYSKIWLEAKGNIKVITGFAFPVYNTTKKIIVKGFNEEGGALGGKLQFDISDEQSDADEEPFFDIKTIMGQYNISPTVIVADVEGSESIITAVKPSYPLSVRLVLMEMHDYMYGVETRNKIVSAITEDGFYVKKHLHGVYLFERA